MGSNIHSRRRLTEVINHAIYWTETTSSLNNTFRFRTTMRATPTKYEAVEAAGEVALASEVRGPPRSPSRMPSPLKGALQKSVAQVQRMWPLGVV